DDAGRIEPVVLPESLAQLLSIAVRVAMDLARESPVGSHCLAARPERALVRGEADRTLDPGHLGFAADIRANLQDPRARHQPRFALHEFSLWPRGPTPRAAPRSRREATTVRPRTRGPRERHRGACRR